MGIINDIILIINLSILSFQCNITYNTLLICKVIGGSPFISRQSDSHGEVSHWVCRKCSNLNDNEDTICQECGAQRLTKPTSLSDEILAVACILMKCTPSKLEKLWSKTFCSLLCDGATASGPPEEKLQESGIVSNASNLF